MKNLFLGLALLFLLSGCGNIALHVSPSSFHSGTCTINTSVKEVARQTHGGPLDLTRQVFEDKMGNFIIYENGLLDDDLIFIASLPDIMKAGFEMDSYRSFSLDRHHALVTGTGREGSNLYILAQSLNEGFSILYSQNYELLRPLVECLGEVHLKQTIQENQQNQPKTATEAIKSDWRVATFAKHRIAVSKYFEEF